MRRARLSPGRSRRTGTLSLAALIAAGSLAAFAGCRGVLGIEPLELVDGGASDATQSDGSGPDAAPDTSPGADTGGGADADAGAESGADAADAGSDGEGPLDAPTDVIAACFAEGGNCRPCCKTTLDVATGRLTNFMVQDGCICGDAGACTSLCATSICVGSPSPPPGNCAMCSDDSILQQPVSAECHQAITDCKGDPTCAAAVECLQSCP